MPSTTVVWWDSRHRTQRQVTLPLALPPKEVAKLQEYFQNTPDGVQRTLQQMVRADPAQNTAPAPQPQGNPAERITSGSFEGFTQDEVAVMVERGLLLEPPGEASESLKVEEEEEEECLTERETMPFDDLLPESSSPPVKLPVCRTPTPDTSPPVELGERSWELRVNGDLTLERRVCTFDELLARLEKIGGTSQV